MSSYRSLACECGDEDGDLYIGKSVILRFVLDVQESGSSNKSVNLQSNYDAHGYVISVTIDSW